MHGAMCVEIVEEAQTDVTMPLWRKSIFDWLFIVQCTLCSRRDGCLWGNTPWPITNDIGQGNHRYDQHTIKLTMMSFGTYSIALCCRRKHWPANPSASAFPPLLWSETTSITNLSGQTSSYLNLMSRPGDPGNFWYFHRYLGTICIRAPGKYRHGQWGG